MTNGATKSEIRSSEYEMEKNQQTKKKKKNHWQKNLPKNIGKKFLSELFYVVNVFLFNN